MSLTPQPSVGEEERGKALRQIVTEGAFASAATALTSGVILTALALHLGASNLATLLREAEVRARFLRRQRLQAKQG